MCDVLIHPCYTSIHATRITIEMHPSRTAHTGLIHARIHVGLGYTYPLAKFLFRPSAGGMIMIGRGSEALDGEVSDSS